MLSYLFVGVGSAFAAVEPAPIDSDLGHKDLKTIVKGIFNVVAAVMAIIAALLLVIGGVMWMTAGGNAESETKARQLMIGAIVGLIIIGAAVGIVELFRSKLFGAG